MSLADACFPLLILLWVTPRQRDVMAKDNGRVWERGRGFALAILPHSDLSLNTQVTPLSVYFTTAIA